MGNNLVSHILSDESDVRSAFIVRIRYITTGFGFLHIHVGDVGRYPADINFVQRLRSQADLAVESHLQPDCFGQPHAVPQSLKVLPRDISIAAHCFEEVLLVGDDGKAHYEKDIRTEIGNSILNVKVGSRDNRHDQDEH